jgi:aspartate 1-decarboxylase
MFRTMMKSKIHRATITGADLDYVSYAAYTEAELASYAPTIVHVDEANRPISEEAAVQRRGSNLVWMRAHGESHLG